MVAHGVDAVELALVAQHGDLSQGLVASQKGTIARSSYIDTVPVGQRLRSGCALPPEVDRPHDAIHPSRFPDYIPPSRYNLQHKVRQKKFSWHSKRRW